MKFKVQVTFTLLVVWCFVLPGFGQDDSDSKMDLSFEFQAYPTGLIPGVRLEKANKRNAYHLRLGYNRIRHGDAGRHNDERGHGFGFTLGYKRHFREGQKGPFAGLRHDFWFNEIEWKNESPSAAGVTKIIVSQPTLEAGWLFVWSEKWNFAPSLALGYEINIHTDGEPTGEGMILLAGIVVGRRLR